MNLKKNIKQINKTNLTFAEYLHENLDRPIQVDVIHTDFSKAFDRTCIRRMIDRLLEWGVWLAIEMVLVISVQ